MSKVTKPASPYEHQSLQNFAEKAYLDYSMYVTLDRALPHIGDGLKPVQRRIIYAMSELGLNALAKYKKSARTVGDVLGKFHPHGDSACYEAMVLMAQSFSYRYPLIDGQGNWGSPDDPKSFAAMRYTESRLTRYAEALLTELSSDTVEWMANFDGTLEEPKLLPARLPNIILNGGSGIAVGMATDIPPHNLNEVIAACLALLHQPQLTVSDLLKYIKGPDFPTAAEIITPPHEIKAIYKTGTGTIRLRAVYTQEEGNIIITALPYQISGAKVIEQIASQMREKKLPFIEDLRDESDHENPTRIVIVPRNNRIQISTLMGHLFASTDLEKTHRINLNMVGLDGRPQVKNLKLILQEWLEYRTQTVRNRLKFRLEKVLSRLHILEGFLIAFLHLDVVIQIIRQENEPKKILINRFKLTETQVEAILELKLRQLAKLEEIEIRTEQKNLALERDEIQKILTSSTLLKKLIEKELQADAKKFANDRCSPIIERSPAQIFSEEEIITNEPITIILSQMGWIRAGKGHEINPESLNFKTGDQLKIALQTSSNQQIVFIDSTGRSYSTPAHTLPSARGQGEPLTGRFNLPSGATVVGMLIGEENKSVVLSTNNGYGFISNITELYCKNRAGKVVIKLSPGAALLTPRLIESKSDSSVAILTNQGYLLIFSLAELPLLSKGKGSKLIHLPQSSSESKADFIKDILVFPSKSPIILLIGTQRFPLSARDLTHYQGERTRRGHKLPRGLQKADHLEISKR